MSNENGFIKKRNLSFLTLILITVVLSFQNCAKPIKDFALQKDQSSSNKFDVPPTEHPLPIKTIKTDYQLQLADRNYVAGVLSDAFGPSAKAIIQTNILLRPEELGGPCSEYSHVMVKSGASFVTQDPSLSCTEEGTTKLITPPPQAVRQGWMLQVCSELVGKGATVPDTLNYVINKIQTGKSSLALPAPSITNLSSLHKLFYRERPLPSASVLDSMKLMFAPEVPSLDNWRTAIFSYCVSSHWQVL